MKRYASVIGCLFLLAFNAKAQSAEDSVKTTINKLFAAMKNGDSKALVECFSDSAILQTVAEKNGNVSIQTEPVKDFADFVGTQKEGDADERITFDMLRVDGALAIAWTPYKFYYKGNFSHCGVDSYQLVRINGTWKIQYLIDTRRKTNCGE
ncbi:MAG TPA: nuclear transport factor 2 family protein [Parafilimonas sp.]|nr:nuclear transport factor 2 family protein [Parafilimonas sp.]